MMAMRPKHPAAGSNSGIPDLPRIVSSAHLAVGRGAEMSEFEYGLIIAWHAFSRWAVRCMIAAGVKDLALMDVLVLHHVYHRARGKRLADICFVLDVEDTHVVSYALKKLVAAGLVSGGRRGKEALYVVTARGIDVIERYRRMRERCLVAALDPDGSDNANLAASAEFLRFMSGLYDQAARAASSL